MRKMLVVLLALLLPFITTEAQEKSDTTADSVVVAEYLLIHQNFISSGASHPRFIGQAYEYLVGHDRLGWWGNAYGESQYLSGTAGLFFDPASVFSIGAAVGAEVIADGKKTSMYGRGALTAFIGTENHNLDSYFENGPSGDPWLRTDLTLFSEKRISIGGIYQTGDGIGPKVRLSIPMTKRSAFRLWAAPLWDKGQRNLLLGGEIVLTVREAR